MTKEYAALIAQVAPVLAIALGLEIRSLLRQIFPAGMVGVGTEALTSAPAITERQKAGRIASPVFAYVIVVACVVQVFLAAIEIEMLSRSTTLGASPGTKVPDNPEPIGLIAIAIQLAFLIPVAEVALHFLSSRVGWQKSSVYKKFLTCTAVLMLLALLSLGASSAVSASL